VFNKIKRLFKTLPKSVNIKILWLVLLNCIVSAIDALTIISIVPYVTVIQGASLAPIDGRLDFLVWLEVMTQREQVITITILFCVFIATSFVMKLKLLHEQTKFVFEAGKYLGAGLLLSALSLPYAKTYERNSAEVLSTLSSKIGLVIGNVVQPIIFAGSSAIQLLVLSIAAITLGYTSAVFFGLAIGCLYILVSYYRRPVFREFSQIIDKQSTAIVKLISESLSGIREVILFNASNRILRQYKKIDKELRDAQAKATYLTLSPRYIIEGTILIIGALSFSLASIISEQSENLLPVAIMLAFSMQKLYPLLQQLYSSYAQLHIAMASLDSILNIYEAEQEYRPMSLEGGFSLDADLRISSGEFSYDKTKKGSVLQNLNLEIPKGTIIGLTGESGSGKSTLSDILLGLLSLDSGQLLLNGRELNGEELIRWRANVARVPQANFIIDDSLAANVQYGSEDPIELDKIVDALRKAGLKDFANDINMSCISRVGEGGAKLSGGQRQRLGIARALFRNAQLIVYDEPTSSLDQNSENQILELILSLRGKKTQILITHSPRCMEICDLIWTIEGGSISKKL
jgi:ABC-type multidrug transport system fused ATPase/permease subunit